MLRVTNASQALCMGSSTLAQPVLQVAGCPLEQSSPVSSQHAEFTRLQSQASVNTDLPHTTADCLCTYLVHAVNSSMFVQLAHWKAFETPPT